MTQLPQVLEDGWARLLGVKQVCERKVHPVPWPLKS